MRILKSEIVGKRRRSSQVLWAIALAILASHWCIASAACAESVNLNIYDEMTQNGTFAQKVFSDESGKPVRVIYYGSKRSTRPKIEEDLIPTKIELYRYENGLESWMGEYSPDYLPKRALETSYDAAGDPTIRQWRDADGIVRYRMAFENKRCVSHLYFDDTGERLIGIIGKITEGLDLHYGWGRPFDGLACGVGVNRNPGKLDALEFQVNMRNVTDSPLRVLTGLPYEEMKVELRDASGQLVPQDAERVRRQVKEMHRMNPQHRESLQTVEPNASQTFGPRSLSWWYSDLPAGTYRLLVRRRITGPEFELVSKPLELTIESQN